MRVISILLLILSKFCYASSIESEMVQLTFYLGTKTQDGKLIDNDQFLKFCEKDIATYFPGMSITNSLGYWIGSKNLEQEKSKHVVILTKPRKDLKDIAKKIADKFIKKFKQFAVTFTLQKVSYCRVFEKPKLKNAR